MSSLNLAPLSTIVEGYMMDTVSVRRITGKAVNATTLAITDTASTIYTGKAFVAAQGQPGVTDVGGQQFALTQFEVALPKSADQILPNDEITVTASAYSPGLVGKILMVVGMIESSFYTHHRVIASLKVDAS